MTCNDECAASFGIDAHSHLSDGSICDCTRCDGIMGSNDNESCECECHDEPLTSYEPYSEYGGIRD